MDMKRAVCVVLWLLGLPFRVAFALLCTVLLPFGAVVWTMFDLHMWACRGDRWHCSICGFCRFVYWECLIQARLFDYLFGDAV